MQSDQVSQDEVGSETSSLFDAEVVCEIRQVQVKISDEHQGGKSKDNETVAKRELSQSEKTTRGRFILSRFDLFDLSWKRTLRLFSESHDSQEYAGKGVKNPEITGKGVKPPEICHTITLTEQNY